MNAPVPFNSATATRKRVADMAIKVDDHLVKASHQGHDEIPSQEILRAVDLALAHLGRVIDACEIYVNEKVIQANKRDMREAEVRIKKAERRIEELKNAAVESG